MENKYINKSNSKGGYNLYPYFKKNKKGHSFILLFPIIAIFILGGIFISTGSLNKAIFDPKFDTIKNYDELNSFSDIEKTFIETYMKNFLKNSNNKFLKNEQELFQNSLENINDKKLIGCNLKLENGDKNTLLYNENNLKIKDENKNNIGLCLKDNFQKNYLKRYGQFIENEIRNNLKEFLNKNEITIKSIDLKTQKDSTILITIKTKSSKLEKGLSLINVENRYEFITNFKNNENLIFEISLVLPKLSEKIKSEVLSCIKKESEKNSNKEKKKDGKNKNKINDFEIFCIKKSFESLIDNKIKSLYDFELNRVSNIQGNENNKFLGLNFIVKSKKTKVVKLEFSTLFKNSIPIGLVEYDVRNFEGVNNVIEINLKKKESKKNIDKYVILYSYSNLLDKNSYSNYGNFIKLLNDGTLLNELKKIDTGDGISTHYSNLKKGLNLNVITTNAKDLFDENREKKVLIYQIFNEQKNEFEFLKSNKKLNILVFAIDSNGNYYTDKNLLKENLKTIKPIEQIGPKPLLNLIVKNDLKDKEQSLELTVSNYDDLNFAYYNLYIMKYIKDINFKPKCEDLNDCEFVDNIVVENPNGKFLITSDLTIDNNLEGYDKIIKLNKLKLEPDIKYKVLLVPVNNFGLGSLQTYGKFYNFIERTTDIKYYDIEKSSANLRTTPKDIVVLDKKSPELNSFSILSNKLLEVEGKLFLQWKPKIDGDVTSVLTKIKVYKSDSTIPEIRFESFDLKNPIGINKELSITSIEIDKIVPVDKSGNSLYNLNNIDSSPSISPIISWP